MVISLCVCHFCAVCFFSLLFFFFFNFIFSIESFSCCFYSFVEFYMMLWLVVVVISWSFFFFTLFSFFFTITIRYLMKHFNVSITDLCIHIIYYCLWIFLAQFFFCVLVVSNDRSNRNRMFQKFTVFAA